MVAAQSTSARQRRRRLGPDGVSVAGSSQEGALRLVGRRKACDPAAPHVVVVVDDDVIGGNQWAIDSATDGVTLLTIQSGGGDPAIAGALRLQVSEDEPATLLSDDGEVSLRPDRMSYTAALACAQRLAGYRAGGPDALAARGGTGWQDLVGIGDLASYTPTDCWAGRSRRDRLRVPIGTTVAGAPLELDIKEAAEKGMGPHGLCIGATGSGKSEFLRTVALGMMARHSPEELNLVLIDFKGGATFSGLEPAPHVAAVITNLSDKAALVSRMREALTGEMNRRQEVLRAAGNVDGIAAYQRARRASPAGRFASAVHHRRRVL